jgi:hypothetical protein
MRTALTRAVLVLFGLGLFLVIGVTHALPSPVEPGEGLGVRAYAQESNATPAAAATPATPVAIDFTQPVAERPAEIRTGSCASPGETLAALTPLEKPEGEAQGQPEAIEAERAYTAVPLPMESLLASPTNISVLLSNAQPDVVIACGDIGGVVSAGGSLVVKLSPRSDSGFTGIAYMGPEDAATTGISLFLAGELTVTETRELVATPTEATPASILEPLPEPTPTAEPVQNVDIALLEWLIDMPAEVRAGQINFVVTNEGTQPHSLVIEGQGLSFALDRPLDAGDTTILTATLPPGDYDVYCPLGDGEHREKGMDETLTVVP